MQWGPQVPLWHWCTICGRALLPDPFAYDLVEVHEACTWAALRWHPGVPADIFHYARRPCDWPDDRERPALTITADGDLPVRVVAKRDPPRVQIRAGPLRSPPPSPKPSLLQSNSRTP